MKQMVLKQSIENVREKTPLVHCITNYVTVNDCANALLAIGGSPIMSDEEDDVYDITSICNGLVVNIGTLNKNTIRGMHKAAQTASNANKPIVLDPVGAGASALRTKTACELLDKYDISLIRGNMSEVKAIAGASASTKGVDVNPEDAVTDANIETSAAFARDIAAKTNSVVAITGAIDIVADASCAYAIRNGSPLMGRITGAGCMLSCISGAFVCANTSQILEASVAVVSAMGVAGQIAQSRMTPQDGNGSFRTYLLDALFNMNGDTLEQYAMIEEL